MYYNIEVHKKHIHLNSKCYIPYTFVIKLSKHFKLRFVKTANSSLYTEYKLFNNCDCRGGGGGGGGGKIVRVATKEVKTQCVSDRVHVV